MLTTWRRRCCFNILRGDVPRLKRCHNIVTGAQSYTSPMASMHALFVTCQGRVFACITSVDAAASHEQSCCLCWCRL